VTLETDTAGNQLQEASDVKVRGVIVGEVRDVRAGMDGATIDLAIDPDTWPRSRLMSPPASCRRPSSASGSSPSCRRKIPAPSDCPTAT